MTYWNSVEFIGALWGSKNAQQPTHSNVPLGELDLMKVRPGDSTTECLGVTNVKVTTSFPQAKNARRQNEDAIKLLCSFRSGQKVELASKRVAEVACIQYVAAGQGANTIQDRSALSFDEEALEKETISSNGAPGGYTHRLAESNQEVIDIGNELLRLTEK